MRIYLNPITTPQNVPQEYHVKNVTTKSKNTYVFSEKDLPGFSSRVKGGGQFKRDDKKDVLAPGQAGVTKDQPAERYTRRRKAIPSR
jgi:hypothetical protein